MLYQGNFFDLKGNKYKVEIVTNGSRTQSKEITLGTAPFVTEMDTSDENIYKSVKYQGATVGIVTSGETDYMLDVYSKDATGTSVTLYDKNNAVKWIGYATPNLYSNGFTEIHENLQIECIDGLSILQYYKYSSTNKQVTTFIDIINKVLAKCKVYKNLYVSYNTRLNQTSSTPILNELYISEQNFFDEKDSNETDDDVAWSCDEVLEEICQFLGLVCVADGTDIYMLDLDALKASKNRYAKYSIGSTAYTIVTLSNTLAIGESNYMGAANTISLDNVYNKVTVKDSFYTFDSVIPNLYDTAKNITKSSDTALASSTNVNNGMYGEVITGGSDGNMIILLDRVRNPEHSNYKDYNVVAVKYYINDNYNFTCPSSLNYTDSKTMHGAVIAKFFVKKMDKSYSYFEQWIRKIIGKELTLDDWMARNEISNLDYTNYVCLFNPISGHDSSGSKAYITTKSVDLPCLFGGANAHLLIKGSYNFHYFDDDPYPIPQGESDIAQGRYAMDEGQTYLLARLQWGNQYWNGSTWTTSATNFKIPYMRDDTSRSERRADGTMFKDLDFVNTVSWRIGTDKTGYIIDLPSTDAVMNGLPRITIYNPIDPNYHSSKSGDNKGQHYKHTRVFLKDFDVIAFIGDPTFSDVNESDTVYTNVISNNHVQDMDEIEFKICTNDNKNPNYSSVGYKSGGNFKFLNTTWNEALAQSNVQEAHLINRLCNQYNKPKIRLELQLENNIAPYTVCTNKWLGTKQFIVDSQSIDYYNNVSTITLVEKG